MRTLQWHCLVNYDFVWSTSFSCLCIFAVFLYDCLCIAFVDSHNIFLCRQLKLKKVEDWRRRREIWNVQCHLSVLCQSATTQQGNEPHFWRILKESTPWHSIPDVLILPLLFIHNPIFVNWVIVIPMTKFT